MKTFIIIFIIFTTYSYAIDSLFTISTTITNIDSLTKRNFKTLIGIQFQEIQIIFYQK